MAPGNAEERQENRQSICEKDRTGGGKTDPKGQKMSLRDALKILLQ